MASDKNLYRGIRLGRIVNSNGRVIGSIVKKKERERERQDKRRACGTRRDGRGGDKRTEWEVRWERLGGGWVVSIIFYPKTAPSLRRAILLICKGASEKWGGEK